MERTDIAIICPYCGSTVAYYILQVCGRDAELVTFLQDWDETSPASYVFRNIYSSLRELKETLMETFFVEYFLCYQCSSLGAVILDKQAVIIDYEHRKLTPLSRDIKLPHWFKLDYDVAYPFILFSLFRNPRVVTYIYHSAVNHECVDVSQIKRFIR